MLGSEGMKPRISCYVIYVEVTGVHRKNCDLVDSQELRSYFI